MSAIVRCSNPAASASGGYDPTRLVAQHQFRTEKIDGAGTPGECLHPRIRAEVRTRLQKLDTPYAIVVIPLLVETGQVEAYNRVLVVDSDESTQVQRVRHRDQRSDQQIQEIMQAQASRTERLSWADDIIENNGTVENLEQNVARLHQTYLKFAKR